MGHKIEFRETRMNQTNESELCNVCLTFYGNPQSDGMCSKCYKESQPVLKKQISNKVDTFVEQSMVPELKETNEKKSVENKIEQSVNTVTSTITEKIEEVNQKKHQKTDLTNVIEKQELEALS